MKPRRASLLHSLVTAEGNPRAAMYTEPLWGIPYNLYAPFASVYMLALGVNDRGIGLIATFGLVLQIFGALLGGPITDKLGRKRATFIFDVISWSIPTLLWAVARSEIWFYLAAFFNATLRITMTSWTCLFIEDAPKNRVVQYWTWVNIAGLAAGVVTPLAGLLIERFELIPTMRVIYAAACVSMTAKFVILNVIAKETRQGVVRMRETASFSIKELALDLMRNVPQMFRSRGTLVAIILMIVQAIYVTIRGTFFSVLLAEGLHFTAREIGIFPAVRSVVMLGVFFFVIPRLDQERHVRYLVLGFVLTLASLGILFLAPVRGLAMIAVASVVEGLGAALLAPYIDGLVTSMFDPHHRARILAVANTLVLTAASPFGWIGGVLSSHAKILPFALAAGFIFVALLVLVVLNPEQSRRG